MIERNFSQQWQPHVIAIGKLTGSLKAYHLEGNHLHPANEYEGIASTSPPSSIVSQNGVSAVIDQKGNLWLVGNIFYEPVNLSQLVRMKAKTVFLGEGQLIMQNKRKDLILITWGSKAQFSPAKLNKIALSNGPWTHLFQAYFVYDQAQQGSVWHYSTVKKLQNTIKLYHLNKQTKQILGLPSKKTMTVNFQPSGMSLGKYHGLTWTEDGKLFGWGSKNLGLGLRFYDKSYYDELQQIILPQPIIKAYAGTNYSIALTKSGILYEWGQNSKNQMIVLPPILDLGGLKFVIIKGFLNIVGGLTSENRFYLWGKGIENIVSVQEKEIVQPYQIKKHENTKILDFQIEQNYVVFTVCEDKGMLSHDQQIYFSEVISKVTTKWLPNRSKSKKISGAKTQEVRSPIATPPQTAKRTSDFIDRLVSQHINKENYFSEIQNQSRFYKKIMQQSASPPILKLQNNFLFKMKQPTKTPKLTKRLHKKVYTAKDPITLAFEIENTSKFIKQMETNLKRQHLSVQEIKKKSKCKNQASIQTRHTKKKTLFLKVEDAQISNYKTCTQFSTQKKINSKKMCNQSEDFFENSVDLQKVADTFNKAYIVKLIMQVILQGKNIKIKQLKKKISADKINYNFNNFNKKKSSLSILSDLQVQKPTLYYKITTLLKNAMRSWKQAKIDKNRKLIMPVIVKTLLKKKIKQGLGSIWLKSRKLKKIAKWLLIQHKQKLMQVKSLWKRWLLLYIKPTPSFQNKRPSVCRQQLSFKPNAQKGKHIRFAQFINKSPIIQFKLPFPVSIQKLQTDQLHVDSYARNQMQYPCLKKGVSWAQKHFRQTKFESTQRDFDRKSNHSAGMIDILPYSYHYNSYFKPKNFQLNIPDNMKQSQKWVNEEKKILDGLLKQYIKKSWLEFCLNKREYETKLALFIRDNYDYLAEYRWKFIIEYNKISHEPPLKVRKRQQEILRLLRKVGAQAIFKNDVIPERHKILDYVSYLKGSPTMPQLQTKLTQIQFKKLFKIYYEQIASKSKSFRKFFN